MPLVVPTLPKVTSISSIIGKRLVDDEQALIGQTLNDVDYPVSNVVYKSQLPSHFLIMKNSQRGTAIAGAAKAGFFPVFVDENDIVLGTH